MSAAVGEVAPAGPGACGDPAIGSPEIAGAIADYWARRDEANAPGNSDEVTAARGEDMEDAAARVAAAPCRSVADLAAKVAFFVQLMNYQDVWPYLTEAECRVLVSAEADAMAMCAAARTGGADTPRSVRSLAERMGHACRNPN